MTNKFNHIGYHTQGIIFGTKGKCIVMIQTARNNVVSGMLCTARSVVFASKVHPGK